MLGAQGIRATGFKRAQGNAHCAKFESHTNRVTFETNAIRVTSSVQALCSIIDLEVLFMNVENSDLTSDYISVPECQHQSNSECLEECAKSTN